MTYPPGNPGYPPVPQYGGGSPQGQSPTGGPGAAGASDAATSSKLPDYLLMAAAVLGFLAFVSSFGPVAAAEANFGGSSTAITFVGFWAILSITSALAAAVFAAITVLPRQRNHTAVAAGFGVLAFLLALAQLPNVPEGFSTSWGLILLLVTTGLLAAVTVVSLLFDAGVITPPQPKPQYDPYGQFGAPGQYYGPPSGQLPAQRPGGYGQPYGGYNPAGGYPGPQSGQPGGSAQPGPPSPSGQQAPSAQHAGSATPPTGFPTFGQPQQGTGQHGLPPTGAHESSPTQQFPSAGQQSNQPPA